MEAPEPRAVPAVPAPPPNRRRLRWPRFLPPVRLVWISLIVLGLYGTYDLRGLGEYSLAVLPALAVAVDLPFQRVRFPRLRFPDAALATGLFLALLFPPAASLVLMGLATFAAVALRHALRIDGHPWMNPAALGVVAGTVLLGLQPAWWVAVGPYGFYLMLGAGILIAARSWRAWRLPVSFLVAYSLFVIAEHLLIGTAFSTQVLILEIADPVALFFALFMVPEPRTAPGDAIGQSLYGIGVGLLAVLLPLAIPSIGFLVALLVIDLVVVGHRAVSLRRPAPRSKARKRKTPLAAAPVRWPIGYRVGSMVLVLIVLLSVVAAAPPPAAPPLLNGGVGSSGASGGSGGGSVGGGAPVTSCATDNPSIPASTLQALHSALGPSKVLSYDSNTGVVVFYDPVNQVTVTETDLYEDFGYAEFNGDDYAVSGCHP